MRLLTACALTIVIETLFFLLIGWRDRRFLLLCISANALTNLCLNLLIWLLMTLGFWHGILVLPLELLVVAAEFCIYGIVRRRDLRLLGLVFAANALSYSVGLLVM